MKRTKYTYYTAMTEDHKFDLNVNDDEDFEDNEVFRVIAKADGEEVGRADFAFHSDASEVVCWQVFVEPEYRRQGIASEMYRLAEERFGEISPFPGGHSKEARAFWKSRSTK